jgi:hypothetical protein
VSAVDAADGQSSEQLHGVCCLEWGIGYPIRWQVEVVMVNNRSSGTVRGCGTAILSATTHSSLKMTIYVTATLSERYWMTSTCKPYITTPVVNGKIP